MDKTKASRKYPPLYERIIPFALYALALLLLVLIVVTIAVALNLIPGTA